VSFIKSDLEVMTFCRFKQVCHEDNDDIVRHQPEKKMHHFQGSQHRKIVKWDLEPQNLFPLRNMCFCVPGSISFILDSDALKILPDKNCDSLHNALQCR
jgi:hypothetical protein